MGDGQVADRRVVYRVLGSQEVQIDFGEIKEGMRIRMTEPDGEPIVADGCSIVRAMSDAFINAEGIWTVSIEACGVN